MKKIDLGQTIAILANVGVLAGIILVAVELNQNTQQLTLEMQWQLRQKYFENNQDMLGDNPAAVYAKSITAPQDLTLEEFHIASAFVMNFLNVWEDQYFLYQAALVSEDDWKSFIDDDIGFTLGNAFSKSVWRSFSNFFEPELAAYVDELLPTVSDSDSLQYWRGTVDSLSIETEAGR